jgi:glucan 1,3-beta-glucosidase
MVVARETDGEQQSTGAKTRHRTPFRVPHPYFVLYHQKFPVVEKFQFTRYCTPSKSFLDISRSPHSMPSNERRRDRRNSRDPESDNDFQRKKRRPSDSQRRRHGHRATDSTGELLPKQRDRSIGHYDSSANSTPRKSRNTESGSGSQRNLLSTGGLAQLDALNAKKDRKKGWETYDEAYLQEVRAKESRLEKERKKVERDERRRDRDDDGARKTEGEEERDLRREAERRRRRDERERTRRTERERDKFESDTPQEKLYKKERRKSKKQQEEVIVTEDSGYEAARNHVRLHEDWKRKQQKYEKIVEPKRKEEKRERLSKTKKQRVISGPYVEDGRAEKAYRRKKESKWTGINFDFSKYKKWMCKSAYYYVKLPALNC